MLNMFMRSIGTGAQQDMTLEQSRQCSNIVTATFGGEQKFFPSSQAERVGETMNSNCTSASVKEKAKAKDIGRAGKGDELGNQKRNKKGISNNRQQSGPGIGGQQQIATMSSGVPVVEGRGIMVGKQQPMINKKHPNLKRKKEEAISSGQRLQNIQVNSRLTGKYGKPFFDKNKSQGSLNGIEPIAMATASPIEQSQVDYPTQSTSKLKLSKINAGHSGYQGVGSSVAAHMNPRSLDFGPNTRQLGLREQQVKNNHQLLVSTYGSNSASFIKPKYGLTQPKSSSTQALQQATLT